MKLFFSMNNRSILGKLAIVSAIAISIVGCKPKYDEIDNNQVISKPYVLFAGDSSGRIVKTNDGFNYETVFGFDYAPALAITVSKGNLVFVKKNVHVIENMSGGNKLSNPTETFPTGPVGIGGTSILCQWTKYNRLYLAGLGPKGMEVSDTNGKPKTWRKVADSTLPINTVITSFTELDNGILIAYDDFNKRFFYLDDPGHVWIEIFMSGLPTSGGFIISHTENTILAADTAKGGKVYYFPYSTAGGAFRSYTGLPANAKIQCIEAPFNQAIIVGTDVEGAYRLPLGSSTFVSANLGMPTKASVRSIKGKYDFYKNDVNKRYVYAATNQGIYRSENNGENWVKVFDGNFVSLN